MGEETSSTSAGTMSTVSAWIAGAIGIGLTAAAALPNASYGRTPSVAAVFPPWWRASEIYLAAARAGDVVDAGGSSFVVILRFGDTGLPARLRQAGALLVLDARALGCAPSRGT